MAAIVFPASPVPGQTFSAAGKTWVYDSTYGWLSTQNANPVAQYIAKVVCVGGETSVDFSNIPANFTDLEVTVSGRDSGASGLIGFFVKINGDATGANYYNTMTAYGISPTTVAGDQTTSAANGMLAGIMTGVSSQANAVSSSTVSFPNYKGTTFYKTMNTLSGGIYIASNIAVYKMFGVWKNAAAINRLTFAPGGTAFAAGTTFTLYGKGAVATSPAVYESSIAPSTPYAGMLWWDTNFGNLKIYYNGVWIDASNIGSGMTKIAQVITTGSQASVAFASIPQLYTDLRLVWTSRDTLAGTNTSLVRCRFNGDATAANYTSTARIGVSGGAPFSTPNLASTKGLQIGTQPNAGNIANGAGSGDVTIPAYRGIFNKRVQGLSGDEDVSNTNLMFAIGASWLSTAPITDMLIQTDGTAFVNGSTFTLYGMG